MKIFIMLLLSVISIIIVVGGIIYMMNEEIIKQLQAESEHFCYACDKELDSDTVLDEKQGRAYHQHCWENKIKYEENIQ